jgi:hypothetical protein
MKTEATKPEGRVTPYIREAERPCTCGVNPPAVKEGEDVWTRSVADPAPEPVSVRVYTMGQPFKRTAEGSVECPKVMLQFERRDVAMGRVTARTMFEAFIQSLQLLVDQGKREWVHSPPHHTAQFGNDESRKFTYNQKVYRHPTRLDKDYNRRSPVHGHYPLSYDTPIYEIHDATAFCIMAF